MTRFKWRACRWSRNLKLHSLCEAETTLHPHTHSHFKSRMSSVHSSSALHKRTTKCARLKSQSPPGTERLAVHTHTNKKLSKNDYVINVCMLWLRCFRWIRLRVNILLAISYSALAALTMLNTQKKNHQQRHKLYKRITNTKTVVVTHQSATDSCEEQCPCDSQCITQRIFPNISSVLCVFYVDFC